MEMYYFIICIIFSRIFLYIFVLETYSIYKRNLYNLIYSNSRQILIFPTFAGQLSNKATGLVDFVYCIIIKASDSWMQRMNGENEMIGS